MLQSLINLLFPPLCPGCEDPLPNGTALLCATCRHNMPFTKHHIHQDNETAKKFLGRVPLEHASALLYFHKEGIVQNLIHNLKYRKQQQVGSILGQWYAPQLITVAALQSVTHIIPIPLHPKKQRERGYNQAAAFGRAIAAGMGAEYNESILLRTTYNKTQTKKNRELRGDIINAAFKVEHSNAKSGSHFLIVDDVITTGATIEACSKLLLAVPNSRVSVVTMAYAHT